MKKHLLSISTLIVALTTIGCGGGGSDIDQIQAEDNINFSKETEKNLSQKEILSTSDYEEDNKRLKEMVIPLHGRNVEQLQLTLVENNHNLMDYQNGKLYLSFNVLPEGASTKKVVMKLNDLRGYGNLYSFQLPFSSTAIYRDYEQGLSGYFCNGAMTRINDVPVNGQAQYRGFASDGRARGELTYNIDFGKREGSGTISGLSHFGEITLHKAFLEKSQAPGSTIQSTIIRNGAVSSTKNDFDAGFLTEYRLTLYGPKAKELGGNIDSSSYESAIIFNGERGEIK